MDDLISRQAAIAMCRKPCMRNADCSDFEMEIMLLPPAQQWIPVSERTPEEKFSVLVWCPEICCVFCAYMEEDKWWIFGASHTEVLHDVLAWMPLPEPYKEDDHEG